MKLLYNASLIFTNINNKVFTMQENLHGSTYNYKDYIFNQQQNNNENLISAMSNITLKWGLLESRVDLQDFKNQ